MRWDILLYTIAMLESGNNANVKPGDDGNAHGIFQIWECYVEDVERISGNDYDYPACAYDIETASEIVKIYITYWGERQRINTGRKLDYESALRLHNGGPHWYKKSHKTDRYWDKGKKILKKFEGLGNP
jgi:hypothetical protein